MLSSPSLTSGGIICIKNNKCCSACIQGEADFWVGFDSAKIFPSLQSSPTVLEEHKNTSPENHYKNSKIIC